LNKHSVPENKRALYAIALNFLSINAILQVYQSLVPLILQRNFQISELLIGIITGGTNFIVCLMLLLLNKMKPTFAVLTLSSILLSITLVITPFSVNSNNIGLFVVLFCSGMMALSLTKVLSNDFTLQVAPAGKENGAMALTKITSTLGGLAALIVMFLMSDVSAFYAMVLLNLLTVGVLFYTSKPINQNREAKEKAKHEKEHTGTTVTRVTILVIILLSYTVYDAMLSTFSRYATNVWNMSNNDFAIYQSICLVAAFIAYIPIGKSANESNQKRLALFGLIAMSTGLLAMSFFTAFHYITIIFFAIIGVGWAAIAVNIVPILVYRSAPKEISRLVGYYSVMSNISLILAPTVSGIVLEYLSYRMLYYTLAGLLILAALLLLFVKTDTKKEIA